MFHGHYGGKKILGLIMICLGSIIILCFVPFWMWCFFLGGALLCFGFLLLTKRY